MRDIAPMAFIHNITEMEHITEHSDHWEFGANVTIEQMRVWSVDAQPSLTPLLTRYASTQVRNSATLGGNIANGSPIGDSPPALIAMGAKLVLRKRTRQEPLICKISLSLTDTKICRAVNLSNQSSSQRTKTICAATKFQNGLTKTSRPFVGRSICKSKMA